MTATILSTGLLVSAWLLTACMLLINPGGDAGGAALRHMLPLFYVGGIVCTGIYFWERGRGPRADLLAPTIGFPVAYAIWFLLGSMDVLPRTGDPVWEPMPLAVPILAAFGLVFYALGTRTAGWTVPAEQPSLARLRSAFAEWDPFLARVVLGAAFLALMGLFGLLVHRIGIPILSADPGRARLAGRKQGIIIGPLFTCVLFFVPASLGWAYGSPDATKWDRRWIKAANVFVPIMIFGLANRGQVVEPALCGLLMLHYIRKPLKLRTVAIIGAVGLVFLSVAGLYRDIKMEGYQTIGVFAATGLPPWALTFGYIYAYIRDSVATFGALLSTIPQWVPYQWGGLHMRPILAYIPGVHESSDVFFKDILYRDFEGGGEPATLIGSFYGDFGIPGIAIGCFLLGLLTQTVYKKLQTRPTSMTVMGYVWLMHACLLSLFGNIFPYPSAVSVPLAMWFSSLILTRRKATR